MCKEILIETLNCFNSSTYRDKCREINGKCMNIITDTLKLAQACGHNKIDFTVTSDYLCDMSMLTVRDIKFGEYDNDMLYIYLYHYDSGRGSYKYLGDCDVWFLLNIVDYINEHLNEFLDHWEK